MTMLWGRYEADWAAQGRGRRWTIVEHPDGNRQGVTQFTLWSAPLDAVREQRLEAEGCPSLEEAKRKAETLPL